MGGIQARRTSSRGALRTSPRRVRRVMRENGLLAPHRVGRTETSTRERNWDSFFGSWATLSGERLSCVGPAEGLGEDHDAAIPAPALKPQVAILALPARTG